MNHIESILKIISNQIKTNRKEKYYIVNIDIIKQYLKKIITY